jgi:hypothetical protein
LAAGLVFMLNQVRFLAVRRRHVTEYRLCLHRRCLALWEPSQVKTAGNNIPDRRLSSCEALPFFVGVHLPTRRLASSSSLRLSSSWYRLQFFPDGILIQCTQEFSWLRNSELRWKSAGSIPDYVMAFFNWPNTCSRTCALGSTQPLTEMSTRNRHGVKDSRRIKLTSPPFESLWFLKNTGASTSHIPMGLHGLS